LTVRALSLDLDDTLWPLLPTIARAERAVHDWLAVHAPRCAAEYPPDQLRSLREQIARQEPRFAHDYTTLRRRSLQTALQASGEDEGLADGAFEVFSAARNQVELFPEVQAALARLTARYPVAALTNGNADLERIGLRTSFVTVVGAREIGIAKPDPRIFQIVCERLGLGPDEVLHIGDDPSLDIAGARGAGLLTAWINRDGATWPLPHRPDVEVPDLIALADWLEAQVAA
jgi:putative hydrolase of the HAD superfamily